MGIIRILLLGFLFYQDSQVCELDEAEKIEPVVIAVIDDGFNIDHEVIKPFVYKNKLDPPFNTVDDDNNGYFNDFQGYDISDGDGIVMPCLLYTSPSPRDRTRSRMPSSA